jgi:hypothetical protein
MPSCNWRLLVVVVVVVVALCRDQQRTEVHSDDAYAPVLYLTIEQFHLEAKSPEVPIPTPIHYAFDAANQILAAATTLPATDQLTHLPSATVQVSASDTTPWCSIVCHCEMQSTGTDTDTGTGNDQHALPILLQAAAVFGALSSTLASLRVRPLFVRVFLDDISAFAQMNQLYQQTFTCDRPPSRYATLYMQQHCCAIAYVLHVGTRL